MWDAMNNSHIEPKCASSGSNSRGPNWALALPFVLALGCANKAAIRPVQTAPERQAPVAVALATPTPAVHVSDELVERCHVVIGNSSDAPRFDFDESELLAQDRDALAQVATCVTTGPLKGHRLQLVGRADPRGTEQYNFDLGQRRSLTVQRFLAGLGVPDAMLNASSRGKLDSTGTDETGWSADRRVDVALALDDAEIAR
jgi:peptidoglycan-associated lipoprotein